MRKIDKELKEQVNTAIEKSMSVIEKLCPQNNVCLGIKVRDAYHNNGEIPKFSMFTACEMLWAITSSGLCSKAHYLTAELLTAVNTELENMYFSKQDRTFEKAFILLGTTSAGQSISTAVYLNTIISILDTQRSDGSWGSYSTGDSDIRATALCILALSACLQYVGIDSNVQQPFSKIEEAINKSCNWLLNQYSKEGFCRRCVSNFDEYSAQYTFGIELTAWSTYALIEANNCLKKRLESSQISNTVQKSVHWLCKLDADLIAKTPENEIEEYKKDKNSNIIIRHEYGAGGLDITIITLIAYKNSSFIKYSENIDKFLRQLVTLLLKNKNDNGEWWDKNSDSYGKAWTLSYALKALSIYYKYLCENEMFYINLKQKTIEFIWSILACVSKYKLAFVFVIATILIFIFGKEIESKIAFFNSPIATAAGLILSTIGVIQGRSKK